MPRGPTNKRSSAVGPAGPPGSEGPPGEPIITESTTSIALLGAELENGQDAFMLSVRDYWILNRDSVEAPFPQMVVPAVGGGNWIRQIEPDVSWLEQLDWGIDSINGGDENLGDVANPLQSVAEFLRRIDRGRLFAKVKESNSYNVSIMADTLDEQCSMNVQMPSDGQLFTLLFFDGSAGTTVLVSDTVTTFIPADPNAVPPVRPQLVGNINFTPFINRVCIVTGGPRLGARFTIAAAIGGLAQVGEPIQDLFTVTPINLQPGDAFDILQFPDFCNIVDINGTNGEVDFTQLNVGGHGSGSHSFYVSGNMSVFVDSCEIPFGADAYSGAFFDLINCSIGAGARAIEQGAYLVLEAGHARNLTSIRADGEIQVDYFSSFTPITIESEGLLRLVRPGIIAFEPVGWLGLFDIAGSAIIINQNGNVDAAVVTGSGGNEIWGSNVTGGATGRISIEADGSLYYRILPNIDGTGEEIVVGGTPLLFADLPYVNPANLAKAVDNDVGVVLLEPSFQSRIAASIGGFVSQ